MQTENIRIGGMTCVNCQNRIEKKLKSLAGVESAEVDYAAGTAKVTYNEAAVGKSEITSAIESLGYTTPEGSIVPKIIGILVIILALSALLRAFGTSSIAASFPLAKEGMGYGMLLVIGLFTSVHCIAMCGGINLSQNLGGAGLLPGVLYNAGRLVSYTAVGVAVGALGSVITISDQFRSIVLALAGLLMVIMGLNMLGLFPALRRFTQKVSKSILPQFFTKKIEGQKAGRGPLVIGILNGFMPCGPLQAMQLYALSTASPIKGGLAMFLFCMGTIPLMFALGAAGGILSGAKGSAFSRRAMQCAAILVAAMGVVMFSNGWSGTGFSQKGIPVRAPTSTQKNAAAEPNIQDGVQIINSTLQTRRYPAITVKQGIPVRWIIDAPQGSITGCNNRFIIREYGIQHTFKYGENVIEFLPKKAGKFTYSCWMNMIRSTITVLPEGEDITSVKEADVTPKPAGVKIPTKTVAVAQIDENNNYQSVEIKLTDNGFEPAIMVVQSGLSVMWNININTVNYSNNSLVFPIYTQRMEMEQGVNELELIPKKDFDFSTSDNLFYGYVKVVNNIASFNMNAVKAEVEKHQTLIYPDAYFEE
jgi:sulfite exporter TauE/SafE/copper chaperone CopZ/plastocyanin domain-containing protein